MNIKTMRLSDGRTLAWAEYGQPGGAPVFFFHGTPGSYLLPARDAALVERLGVRLIVPERPGYGYSDFQPGRTLLDWPDDVVALADALDIFHFAVTGVSGGGPFVAACAYKVPQRLTRVALVSSLAPFALLGEHPQPMSRERREVKARQLETEPEAWFKVFVSHLPSADRVQMGELKSWMIDSIRESYRQGADGVVHEEHLLLTQPWGFALEDITAEVWLWQGEADTAVPVAHGRYLAAHIPNCTATFLAGVGHLLPVAYWQDIYKVLMAAD